MQIEKIVSGGQTGVDRAALDWAIQAGLRHGGWCPKGRRAEDGPIPARYNLDEAKSANYPERTRRNVRGCDATLILNRGEMEGGTLETLRYAEVRSKPVLVVQLGDGIDPEELERVRHWLDAHAIHVLNVAGPRESKRPGIYEQSFRFLQATGEACMRTG